jgi:class 3 adenylate cyclase/tetratricopeptide (TPR) repeat protein
VDCASCGHENPDTARFCGGCGGPLASEVACPACHAENPRANRFCHECGHALATAGARAAQRQPRDYTPRHLVDKILKSKSAMEGERKRVTVLFADIAGSLELAEAVDPEEWHGVLDRFFAIIAEGVHRFEGTINQYTGDGIMALFGAPIAHEDHAQRACYAALQLRDELQEYAREVKRRHALNLSVRMGLNSGEVVVGKIGDDLRMDYTAQGPTVGLASRMEQLSSPDTIYLSPATAALVGGYFDLQDLGAFNVRGIAEPVVVHQLMSAGTLRTRFDVSRARGLTRFVGRDADMQTLETALAQARAGNGQVVGVVADAGTGKSRLCFEFLERCRTLGLTVHEGRAVPHGKNIPYLPMLQVFRSSLGIGERDDAALVRERIAGRLLLLDEALRDVLPVVFDFFGVPDPERPVPPDLDPEARQRVLFDVLRRTIRERDREQPTVALLEDLHWFDPGSEAFLAQHVEAIAGTRNLLLVNFRPEYHAGWMSLSYYRQLPLAPLGPEAIRELLDDLLGHDPSIQGLAEVIHARTTGNPFFTEEVVQDLIEGGNLEGERGAYRLVTPVEKLGVPGTVHSVLAARIDRLAEREKQVLHPAAVIGKEFAEPILRAVADLPTAELTDSLQRLKSAEFIYEQSLYPVSEYAFKHPLTQEVALGAQLQERRRRTHAGVARAIEAAFPEKLDEQSPLLAHHWEEAGEALQAARFHRRAAEWLSGQDFAEAQRHWERVLALTEKLTDEEAMRLSLRARERLLANGWRTGLGEEETESLAESGRLLAQRLGDPGARVDIEVSYTLHLYTGGRPDRALQPARNAVSLAEDGGSLADRCLARGILVDVLQYNGDYEGALRESARVLEMSGGDLQIGMEFIRVSMVAWSRGRRGWISIEMGRPDEGHAELQAGHELARQADNLETAAWCLALHSCLEELTGGSYQGVARAHQALDIAERLGSPITRAVSLLGIGRGLLAAGQATDAVEPLREAVELIEGRRVLRQWRPLSFGLLAEALLAAENAERARMMAEDAVRFAREGGLRAWEPRAHLALARVMRAQGASAHEAAIRESLARAEARIAETGVRGYGPLVREEAARLAAALGDAAGAEAALRTARAYYEEVGASGHAQRLAREIAGG